MGYPLEVNQELFADFTALVDDSVEKLNKFVLMYKKVLERRKLKIYVRNFKVKG